MSPHHWTPEDDAVLIANYSRRLFRDIGALLGLTAVQVQYRANILIARGQLDPSARYWHRKWCTDDDQFLNDNWGLLPDRVVAQRLRRSAFACQIRAKRAMRLCRKMNVFTARDTGRIFGVDAKTILAWLRRGWLRGAHAGFSQGGQPVWNIDQASIERLITDMPWAYDWRRMEAETYWRNMAERIWRRDPWLTRIEAARIAKCSTSLIAEWMNRGALPYKRRPKQGGRPRRPAGSAAK